MSPHSLEMYGCKNSASILFHKSRFRLRDSFWPVEASVDNNGARVGDDDDDKLEDVAMVACLVRDLPQFLNSAMEISGAHKRSTIIRFRFLTKLNLLNKLWCNIFKFNF